MKKSGYLKSLLAGGVSAMALATAAYADQFNIPGGDLKTALDAYAAQTNVELLYPASAVRGASTKGAKGELTASAALSRILSGTGFAMQRDQSGAVAIVPAASIGTQAEPSVQLAQATPGRAAAATGIESVVVTSSKIKGDIQTVPIAITALSQEQLTSRQIAGGPDLVREVPNLTFSKTNFSGYNIEIRGIGTQAISVTTDPGVAVAFNDIPFIRNHFFEQEFYDVSQVEVVRGPQGTLYGRNATAGVVNVISAKPTDQYEAQASVDVGNYNNRRMEGMVNIPIAGDQLDLRVAGEWTKRNGYTFDEETDQSVDGRDLWSGRVSLLVHPIEKLTATLIWEHFSEDDDRLRSGKQLCTRDPGLPTLNGPLGPQIPNILPPGGGGNSGPWFNQGCLPGPLYGPTAFETPNVVGAVPFVAAEELLGRYIFSGQFIPAGADPYAGVVQSQSLRVIDSQLRPSYTAKNDTVEFNADFNISSALTLTSQTGFNKDSLYSTEDYNRFNSLPNVFVDPTGNTLVGQDGQFCDPQLGCSTRFLGEDVSQEHARQYSQEFRLASNFAGPVNFVAGANFLNYQTVEDYYVLFNLISLLADGENSNPYFGTLGSLGGVGGQPLPPDAPHIPFDASLANSCDPLPADPNNASLYYGLGCEYIDPSPLNHLNGQGHNYFRSENPYQLNSWAGFGEVYYQVTQDVKLTGGLRWTDDSKRFTEIPSWTLTGFKGYPVTGVLRQQWEELTGRFNATWTPKLDFTDQSLFYGSYSRGYKGGGANPPGVIPISGGIVSSSPSDLTHPPTFKPEFVDAFELGTKNTLLDGAMTFNADVFYYKYQNYQISQIVDRTSVTLNFNADVKGAEVESTWEPVPGLRFNLSGGYENATLANGSQAIDLMDRTDAANHPGWVVVKPFVTATSNCIFPTYVAYYLLVYNGAPTACFGSYGETVPGETVGYDPVTQQPYMPNPAAAWWAGGRYLGYVGFDPGAGTPGEPNVGQNVYNGVQYLPPNNGEGFAKNLSGNQLPNAPHFTTSLGGQYTMPVSENWAATLRSDFYWQSQSMARVYNDRPYDKIRGYSTTNLALIFTNSDGWEAMAYMKNVFNKTAITGAFLNSDDTALTTNIFTTDPRLYGMRITKNF